MGPGCIKGGTVLMSLFWVTLLSIDKSKLTETGVNQVSQITYSTSEGALLYYCTICILHKNMGTV